MNKPAHSPWLPSVIAVAVLTTACAATAVTLPVRPDFSPDGPTTAPSTTATAPPTTRPATNSTISPTTTSTVPPITSTAPAAPPQAIVRPCPLSKGTAPPIDGDPISASVQVAHTLVCSSTDVVVTAPGGYRMGARAAQEIGGPLVFADPDSPYDPAPLGAARIWTTDPDLVRPGPHSVLPLPERLGPPPPLVQAIDEGTVGAKAVRASIEGAKESSTLVVASRHHPRLGVTAAASANATGHTVVWSDPGDMRRRRSLARLASAADHRLLVGGFGASSTWQMDVLAGGRQLPGGGQVLFPGRRIVALYGHPHTAALGALGEQPLDEAVARAAEMAGPYATDEAAALPAFEIIATTASAAAGGDGDYSAELSVDELRPWVEAAGKAGYYVILDLQPGRTDFLTQARRYEELLRLPHVGLGLDPEWRLAPDAFHLRQIGSVGAGEINQVVRWLAGIVREERLPQKLLVVHQFKLTMIPDREKIEAPSELAVVIHMDGQGPIGTKYDTWDTLKAADDRKWLWGWKNFFDEDSPTPTPGQVLDLEPVPVFVSYQ